WTWGLSRRPVRPGRSPGERVGEPHRVGRGGPGGGGGGCRGWRGARGAGCRGPPGARRGWGMRIYVGVAGASRPEPPLLDQAEVLGRRLGEAGAVVVCGGGPGVMEAVCRGAQSAGGTTIGLLPGLDRAEGNPYLTVSIPTGLGQGRNLLLVRSSDAVI